MLQDLQKKYADLLYNNVAGFEEFTLKQMGKRIKQFKRLNSVDKKALENLINIGLPMDEIYDKLAEITELNIAEVKKMYEEAVEQSVLQSQKLYQAKGKPFVPYKDNLYAQSLVMNWAEQTAGTMINLSKTKAIGLSPDGKFMTTDKAFKSVIDKAVISVRAGSATFDEAIQNAIKQLGGSGMVTNYGSGVTRQLDSVVRQTVLYGSKQSAQAYQDYVAEELGGDGIEVEYHPHPRKSHEFIGGRIFSLNGKKTINGITYPDAAIAFERMNERGCLHEYHYVFLGISEPAWNEKELKELKAKDKKLIEYNGKKKTLNKWQDNQRALERLYRKTEREQILLESSGYIDKSDELKGKMKDIRKSYKELCSATGLQPTYERMIVY